VSADARPFANRPGRAGLTVPGDLRSALSPAATFERAFGVAPFLWQQRFLAETGNVVLLKGRQVGASTAVAALCIHAAVFEPGSLSVIVSPTMRQSMEIAAKARAALRNLDRPEPLDADSATTIGLSSGSRIMSLPGTATSIRGYSARLLVVDEAAFVDEETWQASQALVAATGGRIIVLSTPAGRAGWFHDLWQAEPPAWTTIKVRTADVPTVTAAYLESAKATLGPWAYAMEFEAEFGSGGASIFDEQRLWGLVTDKVPPLFGSEP